MQSLCILLLGGHAFAAEEILLPLPDAIPLTSVIIDHNDEHRYVQYNLYADQVISPYVAVGEDEDAPIEENYWRDNSYESVMTGERSEKRWAGLKVRLHRMFNLDIDAKQRNLRSTFTVDSQSDVKLRVTFKEIKAQYIYKF